MDRKKVIIAEKAPKAIGPYSAAISYGNFIFTSGQLGLIPESGEPAGEDIRSQTRQALKNVQSVLEAAGTDLSHVLKTTVFLRNMDDFAAMNEIYAEFFTDECPARSAVQVAKLPRGLAVEIEVIAAI
ncbi:MAG TPA: RidA family protein [Flexilinea sp.]|jgi:2-iminobutanoate/2-iminopropanoate deaminase|nr:RidA family protein [Flexilinea sp.]OQA24679.1 MAG: Enamine/imine deaminase [Chloroflexi bacterium ADurb.Bin344]HNY95190.1 RidA family protein [Flexilinea sp.]HOG61457.1 RidA family protein [Flexilinea sp.]HOP02199.1 RidA family protein [Flexilinea sp.]